MALLVACGGETKPTPDDTQATAAPVAKTTASPSATEEKPAPLKAATAKEFKATAEQDLGTLPDGVGIAVGDAAPDFELPAVEGGKVKLSELTKKSEVLLVFYRGGW